MRPDLARPLANCNHQAGSSVTIGNVVIPKLPNLFRLRRHMKEYCPVFDPTTVHCCLACLGLMGLVRRPIHLRCELNTSISIR